MGSHDKPGPGNTVHHILCHNFYCVSNFNMPVLKKLVHIDINSQTI